MQIGGSHISQTSNDCNPFISMKTTNYKSNQIRSCNQCPQPTLSMNYYLINLFVMSHAIKLLKLPCFSAVLLYTQLSLVCIEMIQILKLFQSQYLLLYIFLPHLIIIKSIIKCMSFMHNFRCKISDNCFNITFQFNSIILSMFHCHIH